MNVGASKLAKLKIGDVAYGQATDTIRRVIQGAERHQWFPKVTAVDSATTAVRDRLARQFEIIGEAAMARSLLVDFVQGGWDVLAETYRAINPPEGDPSSGRGKWRDLLAVVAGEMRRELERSRREAIVPPLFPVAGNAGILAGMITTQIGGARIVDDEDLRETVWYLMCDVDADFWSALIWPLAYEARRDENPFEELVATYMNGFYPLGFIGERFIVYSYT